MSAADLSLPQPAGRVPMSTWLALLAMVVLMLALTVDRELLVLLTDPIKLSMGASDLQIGLLQGAGGAIVGALVAYPLGWLADRFDRRVVLAGCVIVWALAILAAALAPGFEVLFAAVALAAIGPSGLMPVTFSMIPALFTGPSRQLANSAMSIAGNMGRGLVVLACGAIISSVEWARPWLPAALQTLEGWRLSCLVAVLPLPLLLWIISRLPPTQGRLAGRAAERAGVEEPGDVGMGAFLIAHRRAFMGLFGGMTVAVMSFSPLMVWLPVAVMREFGDTPSQTSGALGVSSIIAALAGVVIATSGLHRLQRRLGHDMPMTVITAASAVTAVTVLSLLLAGSALQVYVLMTVQMSVLMAAIMIFPTVLQDIAPAALRGRMAALLGMVTMLGGAGGPALVGAISDRMAHRPNGLMLSVVIFAALGSGLGALLFAWARRPVTAAIADALRLDRTHPSEPVGSMTI